MTTPIEPKTPDVTSSVANGIIKAVLVLALLAFSSCWLIGSLSNL